MFLGVKKLALPGVKVILIRASLVFCFVKIFYQSGPPDITPKKMPIAILWFKIASISFVLLSTFSHFAVFDGEITPSRQKKKQVSFVLLSTFRHFVNKIA